MAARVPTRTRTPPGLTGRPRYKHIVLPSWVTESVDEDTQLNEDGRFGSPLCPRRRPKRRAGWLTRGRRVQATITGGQAGGVQAQVSVPGTVPKQFKQFKQARRPKGRSWHLRVDATGPARKRYIL